MNEQERKDFVFKEIDAIYEEFSNDIDHLVLLRHFFKDTLEVAKGAEPNYKASEIFKTPRIK